MRSLPVFGAPMGQGSSAVVAPLADGYYWYNGNAISDGLTPNDARWNSTLLLNDGVAGDQTTRENATGATISLYRKFSSSSISTLDITMRYDGPITEGYYQSNGSVFSLFNPTLPGLWGSHVGVAFERATISFPATSMTGFVAVMLAAVGIGSSDVRPA